MDETGYITNHYGKWSQSDVPHKGWFCIDIEDTGEQSVLCEMCESQHIRYIHYMKHPDYKDVLGVGCICAGNMEQNLVGARQRDDFMKKRSVRRLRWISNNKWKISQKGNEYIKTDGYIIAMKKRGSFWSALVESEDQSFQKWSYRQYESIEMAKLAAFDYLTKVLAESKKTN